MSPRCWYCDTEIRDDRIELEGVLVPRETSRGGPLWVLPCPECSTENGAERNAVGDFLLTPRVETGLGHLVASFTSRRRLLLAAHARRWFRENDALRREFHAVPPRPRTERDADEPEPPEPEPEPSPGGRPEPTSVGTLLEHYRTLGIPLTATADQVAAAYRKASQKCHPDKVAHLDEEFQALADRKFRSLRDAYESVMDGLSEPT